MKPTWAIEYWESRFDDLSNLIESCKKQNIDYFQFDLSDAFGKTIPHVNDEGCFVFFGSINVARDIVAKTSWIPGAFRTTGHYLCSYYYPRLGNLAMNAGHYIMMPYGDLLRNKNLLFRSIAEDGAVFIRPDSNDKEFTGKLVFDEDFEKDVGFMGFYDVPPELMCVISAPVNIKHEWRFVMVDGEPITGSHYKNDRDVEYTAEFPQEAFDTAKEAGKKLNPDRVWVCDICETKAGYFYVIEIGSFSNCGLYKCDTDIIVERVSSIALEEYNNAND